MKVGVIKEPHSLAIVTRDPPRLPTDSVLIDVKRVGICGSDIHIYHGKNAFAQYPCVWGHEFTGEVSLVGPEVRDITVGDHVVVEPILSCGICYACRVGRPNVCQSLRVMGVHTDGGCREMAVVPASKAHKLPKSLSWEHACLIEPFTIGAQAVRRGDVRKGDFVLVMGAGPIGLTALAFAKLAGATVIVADLVEEKLRFAKERGADFCINAGSVNMIDAVMDITDKMGANVTIDAVCNKKSFEDAILVSSVAGRVVELSFSETPSEIAPLNIIKKEISVCGSRLQTCRFPVVIDQIKAGKLKLDDFVTRVFPFERMAEAFDFVDKNNASVRKVQISFE